MDLGVHLPLMQFGEDRLSLQRLQTVVDTAKECGFAAVSANDHFLFRTPWLDGPTALASVIERSGSLSLATTVALPVLRGPVALAKMLTAIDVLSGGRLTAAVGPGSSQRDYEAIGVPFEERWQRFDESVGMLRSLLAGTSEIELLPASAVPLWVGSWGSNAGLERVARLGDGWLASAYNTTPDRFAAGRARLAPGFPNALATMWTWVSEDRVAGERVLTDVLAPLLGRDPSELRGRVCVGSAQHCAELLSLYRDAGCDRVYLWPLGDERGQLETVACEVAPLIT